MSKEKINKYYFLYNPQTVNERGGFFFPFFFLQPYKSVFIQKYIEYGPWMEDLVQAKIFF